MAIEVTCGCGKTTRVKDEHAGRSIRCPGCQATVAVPVPVDPGVHLRDAAARRWSGRVMPEFSWVRVLLLLIAILSGIPATLGLIATAQGQGGQSDSWATVCLIFTMALTGLAASGHRA